MDNLSFTVWKDPESQLLPQTYYFDVDKNGNPIKLGDGSFGIVFRVRKSEKEKTEGEFAVKIFHTDETIQNRFRVELEFWDEIKRVAETKKIPKSELIGVVTPLGGSSSFHESPAYKNLFKKGSLDLKMSSYAIVMDRYDNTLKHLLESKDHGTHSGYEILKYIRINERVKYILPFIKDCIAGLKALYIVQGNAHLDLKPANLFYKLIGDRFEIAIADMGCLRPVYHDPGTSMTLPLNEDTRRKQLLGTINYRSPEQKDFQEICDGKVQHTDEGDIEILIQDPKFNNSIIEEGDLVFFSKSSDNTPFIIQKFERPETPGEGFTRIVLMREERTSKILDDEKTQIVIHKLQQIRTDLFGIGAITYDLITCGQSPERFYERIRIWDDKKNSVEQIMERYRRLVNDNFSEPQSKHVFESLNSKGGYAPEKIVKFILKCMLYHSSGNYYDQGTILNQSMQDHSFSKEQIILNQLQNDFKNEIEPEKKDGGLGPVIRTDNPLIKKEIPDNTFNPYESLSISSILRSLQKCPHDKNASRLMIAYHYFDLLFEFTNKIFEDDKFLYFAEFNPDNIKKIIPSINGNEKYDQLKYIAFPKREDYYTSLKDYELQIKIKTDPNSFFIPLELVHIYRPILLLPPGEIKESRASDNIFNFQFAHRSYPYDEVRQGDWILLRKKVNLPNELYQITWVDNDANLLKVSLFDIHSQKINETHKFQHSQSEESDSDELLYYKNIDRGAYYLQILGVYIHQLFFLGLNDANEVSIPPIVDIINIESARREEKKFICLDAEIITDKYFSGSHKSESNPMQKAIFGIYADLINMYAKLVLKCLTNTYYRTNDKAIRSVMSDIRASLYGIREKIERTFQLGNYDLRIDSKFVEYIEEYFTNDSISSDQEYRHQIDYSNQLIQENFPSNFHFEDILEAMIVGEKPKNNYFSELISRLIFFVKTKYLYYVGLALGIWLIILLAILGITKFIETGEKEVDYNSIIDSLEIRENIFQDSIDVINGQLKQLKKINTEKIDTSVLDSIQGEIRITEDSIEDNEKRISNNQDRYDEIIKKPDHPKKREYEKRYSEIQRKEMSDINNNNNKYTAGDKRLRKNLSNYNKILDHYKKLLVNNEATKSKINNLKDRGTLYSDSLKQVQNKLTKLKKFYAPE